jgi:hypothetical protein
METKFSAGLAWVKAKKPYSGAVGLAGLGRVTARITRLRHFSYPGTIGLAGLSQVKLG